MYTYESLEPLTKAKLLELAEYRGVSDVSMRMLKGDIIKTIIEKSEPKPIIKEAVEPQMSARVRRIKESQEKK